MDLIRQNLVSGMYRNSSDSRISFFWVLLNLHKSLFKIYVTWGSYQPEWMFCLFVILTILSGSLHWFFLNNFFWFQTNILNTYILCPSKDKSWNIILFKRRLLITHNEFSDWAAWFHVSFKVWWLDWRELTAKWSLNCKLLTHSIASQWRNDTQYLYRWSGRYAIAYNPAAARKVKVQGSIG